MPNVKIPRLPILYVGHRAPDGCFVNVHSFCGERDGSGCMLNPSIGKRRHSLTVEWGGGDKPSLEVAAGSAQLAQAMLGDYLWRIVGDGWEDLVDGIHQVFRRTVIDILPAEGWTISGHFIAKHVERIAEEVTKRIERLRSEGLSVTGEWRTNGAGAGIGPSVRGEWRMPNAETAELIATVSSSATVANGETVTLTADVPDSDVAVRPCR